MTILHYLACIDCKRAVPMCCYAAGGRLSPLGGADIIIPWMRAHTGHELRALDEQDERLEARTSDGERVIVLVCDVPLDTVEEYTVEMWRETNQRAGETMVHIFADVGIPERDVK